MHATAWTQGDRKKTKSVEKRGGEGTSGPSENLGVVLHAGTFDASRQLLDSPMSKRFTLPQRLCTHEAAQCREAPTKPRCVHRGSCVQARTARLHGCAAARLNAGADADGREKCKEMVRSGADVAERRTVCCEHEGGAGLEHVFS